MEGHWVLKLVIFSCGNKQLQCVSGLKATRIYFPLSYEDCGTSEPSHPQVSSYSRPGLRGSCYGDGLCPWQEAATCEESGCPFKASAWKCHVCFLSHHWSEHVMGRAQSQEEGGAGIRGGVKCMLPIGVGQVMWTWAGMLDPVTGNRYSETKTQISQRPWWQDWANNKWTPGTPFSEFPLLWDNILLYCLSLSFQWLLHFRKGHLNQARENSPWFSPIQRCHPSRHWLSFPNRSILSSPTMKSRTQLPIMLGELWA